MKNKLYLHIGLEKTGTTSFQNAISKIQDDADIKIFSVDKSNQKLVASFILSSRKNNLWANRLLKNDKTNYFNKLLEFLKKNQSFDIIISSEHLSGRLFKDEISLFLKSLSKYHNLDVLIVLRDNNSWMTSKYKEAIKNGFSGTLEDYQTDDGRGFFARNDQRKIINDWENKFLDFYKLVVFNYSDHIVSDIFQYLHLEMPIIHKKNISLRSDKFYEFVRFLNNFRLSQRKFMRLIIRKIFFQ